MAANPPRVRLTPLAGTRRLLVAFSTWLRVQRRKILRQHAVNEDIAAAHFAQEDALGGVVEEADVVKGNIASAPQNDAKYKVLDKSKVTQYKTHKQPDIKYDGHQPCKYL